MTSSSKKFLAWNFIRISQLFLAKFENESRKGDANKPDGIEDTDPGWVGAWWIGFIACGVGKNDFYRPHP